MKNLYKNIINDLAKIVKKQLNETRFEDIDHSNNNGFKYIKKRIMYYFKNLGCYATLLSPTSRTTDNTSVDIKIRENKNKVYKSDYIGLKVVCRKSTSKDNFYLKINEQGINLFTNDDVTHIAFVFDDDVYADKHEILILPKDLIKEIYNNLKDAAKRKIKFDKYHNFIWRTGICLSNKFILKYQIDNFMLNALEL